ncbi:MAG: alpha/beta hydrolase [Deltaproteobacteria bacterium]|nr:alpha/beta hydrolase [Deltaproteobacteria bacterium]
MTILGRKRRVAVAAMLALSVVLAFTAARCDRRTPGAAAPVAADETLADGVRRIDVRFACGDTTCAAWLFRPPGVARPPLVVMGHGFAGTRDAGLPYFAERFARAGMAALVFDYRHFGASGGLPRQVVDPWRQLDDWRAALAWGRARPDLDGGRVALWGTSLGAGHALTVAAGDAGLAAVVAQVPMIDSDQEGEATFYGPTWVARLLASAWLDMAASAYGADPIELPAIAPAGGFGMIVDDRASAAAARLAEPGTRYRNAVAARSIFLFDDYNPAPRLDAIRAPVLLIASPRDRFAPFAAVEAFAARAPGVELVRIDADHFDVYLAPVRDAAADAAVAFLRRRFGID